MKKILTWTAEFIYWEDSVLMLNTHTDEVDNREIFWFTRL